MLASTFGGETAIGLIQLKRPRSGSCTSPGKVESGERCRKPQPQTLSLVEDYSKTRHHPCRARWRSTRVRDAPRKHRWDWQQRVLYWQADRVYKRPHSIRRPRNHPWLRHESECPMEQHREAIGCVVNGAHCLIGSKLSSLVWTAASSTNSTVDSIASIRAT